MLPLLESIADGQEHLVRDVTAAIADRFGLSQAERKEMLPSGQQSIIANRVAWAKTFLKKAGLLSQPRRGVIKITVEGHEVLKKKPIRVDKDFLRRYPVFEEFLGRGSVEPTSESKPTSATPEELLEASYLTLHNALADELLERVKAASPEFFERLVVELLVAMGYGGSLADAGQAVGRVGDGGIDGVIKEDKLGLDVVCIQAKRWDNTVGSGKVREFAGSMEGFKARKGVLITTSSFSHDAKEFVKNIERKIVLIDGIQLAELMIDHGIGVETARAYAIKKVDQEYFVDEEGLLHD
jgi:restriction system protein